MKLSRILKNSDGIIIPMLATSTQLGTGFPAFVPVGAFPLAHLATIMPYLRPVAKSQALVTARQGHVTRSLAQLFRLQIS